MSTWIYTIILSITIFFLIYLYFTRNFNYWKKRNVPYAKPIPFLGNMLPMFTLKIHIGEWFQQKYNSIDADYFGIFAFDEPVLVLKSPQLIKNILQKDFSYFEDRTISLSDSDEVLSKAIFFNKNPAWRRIRSKLTPIYSSGKLKLMFQLIVDQSIKMNEYIARNAASDSIEVKEMGSKFSTDVIAKCAFAVEAKSLENENAEFRQIGKKMNEPSIENATRIFAIRFLPSIVKFFNIGFVNPKILKAIKDIFFNVLHERQKTQNFKGSDLVDLMLRLKENNKDEEDFNEVGLLAQSLQVFAAGTETTASTLSFALYELCIATDIQQKLREEILENIEKNGGLTYEGINDIKYLDMVVSETLRKYPVLAFLDRMCKRNYQVPGTDLVIEKGISVFIPLFGLHYDEKYFPNPQKFDPERFRDKTEINKDGFYYIPFGEGPRICIGNRFGTMTVKIGLASILSKFELTRSKQTPVPLTFDPKSFGLASPIGLPLNLTPLS